MNARGSTTSQPWKLSIGARAVKRDSIEELGVGRITKSRSVDNYSYLANKSKQNSSPAFEEQEGVSPSYSASIQFPNKRGLLLASSPYPLPSSGSLPAQFVPLIAQEFP
jgi:hypothetical protein